jgi:hypothetical protein
MQIIIKIDAGTVLVIRITLSKIVAVVAAASSYGAWLTAVLADRLF